MKLRESQTWNHTESTRSMAANLSAISWRLRPRNKIALEPSLVGALSFTHFCSQARLCRRYPSQTMSFLGKAFANLKHCSQCHSSGQCLPPEKRLSLVSFAFPSEAARGVEDADASNCTRTTGCPIHAFAHASSGAESQTSSLSCKNSSQKVVGVERA